MSIYFKKGTGWRYDFILQGNRYTKAWFKTKAEARQAEAKKREETKESATGCGDPNRHGLLGVG